MRERVRLVSEELLAKNWGTLKRTSFDFQRRDGTWQRLVRETYENGRAAAVLLHCPEQDTVLLVRQFRLPIYAQGRDGAMLEVCAGLLEDEAPADGAQREAEEEAGVRIKALRHAFNVDTSPGSLIETIACFVGTYDAASRVSAGGGLEAEGEDIEVIELPLAEALVKIASGEITDAKTILLLQFLALHP